MGAICRGCFVFEEAMGGGKVIVLAVCAAHEGRGVVVPPGTATRTLAISGCLE